MKQAKGDHIRCVCIYTACWRGFRIWI